MREVFVCHLNCLKRLPFGLFEKSRKSLSQGIPLPCRSPGTWVCRGGVCRLPYRQNTTLKILWKIDPYHAKPVFWTENLTFTHQGLVTSTVWVVPSSSKRTAAKHGHQQGWYQVVPSNPALPMSAKSKGCGTTEALNNFPILVCLGTFATSCVCFCWEFSEEVRPLATFPANLSKKRGTRSLLLMRSSRRHQAARLLQ